MVSVTDPYGRIPGFLDRTCCVNLIDNTHYVNCSKVTTLFKILLINVLLHEIVFYNCCSGVG
jgi:hypothetical protein